MMDRDTARTQHASILSLFHIAKYSFNFFPKNGYFFKITIVINRLNLLEILSMSPVLLMCNTEEFMSRNLFNHLTNSLNIR